MSYIGNERYEYFRAGIKDLRLSKKLNQEKLSEISGINRGTISHIEAGRRPAPDTAQWNLSMVFNMTPEQVIEHGRRIIEGLTPEKPPEKQTRSFQIIINTPEELSLLESPEENYRGIPLYESGKLAAGSDNGVYFDPNEDPASEVLVYRPELKHRSHHKLVAVRVGGDSMTPTIPKDSIIVVDMSDREYIKRKIFCVNDPDDTGQWVSAVKRVQKWEKGYALISDNADVPPKLTALDWNQLCVGRVIWMWRNTEEL